MELVLLLLFVVLMIAAAEEKRKKQRWKTTYDYRPGYEDLKGNGNARLSTDADCNKAGLYGSKGILCGYSPEAGHALRWNGDAMITEICPAGGGKDTCSVGPNIFSLDDRSLLIVDVKGESVCTTGHYRARLGPVFVLNPYQILLPYMQGLTQARYNPTALLPKLSEIERGALAAKLADGIVWKESSGVDQFFNRSAELGVQGVITGLSEIGDREENNLGRVAEIISGNELYEFAREVMRRSSNSYTRARLDRFTPQDAEGNKTINAIKETMATEVAFLTEPAIRDCLSGSDFTFSQLREQICTVYVVVPVDKLGIAAKFFRLMVSCALGELLQPGRGKKRVTVIMNEAYSYGALSAIPELYGIGRGFNVQGWTLWQNLSQMKERFPNAFETLLANSGLRIIGKTEDETTSKYASSQTGLKQVFAWTKSVSGNERNGQEPNENYGTQVETRPVLYPHEINALPQNKALVWVRELPNVIVAGRKPYFTTPAMKAKARPNPYYREKTFWEKLAG